MINPIELYWLLKEQQIDVKTCNGDGIVVDVDGIEIQDRKDVALIIEKHKEEKIKGTPLFSIIGKGLEELSSGERRLYDIAIGRALGLLDDNEKIKPPD